MHYCIQKPAPTQRLPRGSFGPRRIGKCTYWTAPKCIRNKVPYRHNGFLAQFFSFHSTQLSWVSAFVWWILAQCINFLMVHWMLVMSLLPFPWCFGTISVFLKMNEEKKKKRLPHWNSLFGFFIFFFNYKYSLVTFHFQEPLSWLILQSYFQCILSFFSNFPFFLWCF